MKKLLWLSAVSLAAVACLTACDDSSSEASYGVPEYKTEAALPDTCQMEVAKVDTAYFACFENKWVQVTDSATVEQLKEGLDEKELKEKLEELKDLISKLSSSPVKPSSSSEKIESSESEEPESSSSEEKCTGRRCGDSSSSVEDSDDDSTEPSGGTTESSDSNSSGSTGSGSDATGSSGDATESSSEQSLCVGVPYDPAKKFCDLRDGNTYNYTTIGTGENARVWMTQNMYFGISFNDVKDEFCSEGDKFCREQVVSACYGNAKSCKADGYLYVWAAAKHVCPEGWRLPTKGDFDALWSYLYDYAGKDEEEILVIGMGIYDGWLNGKLPDDDFSVSFQPWPTGLMYEKGTSFGLKAEDDYGEMTAFYWSSTEDKGKTDAIAYYFYVNSEIGFGSEDQTNGMAVRCVRDPKVTE